MIIQKIIGGLGNQIAQYAFARVCADRLGVTLKLDLTAYRDYKLHDYALDRFVLEAEVATEGEIAQAKERETLQERTLLFDPDIPGQVRDGVYMEGYWGDYRYSLPGIERLRECFLPKNPLQGANANLLREIQEGDSVSLHIRRGDYIGNPNYIILPMTYYEDALAEILQEVPSAHIYVFSDDMEWVEANLAIPCPHTFVRGNDASRNVEEMQLMRSCRHHIVANSSFSGWAAWLDGRSGGIVIAPQQCFTPSAPYLIQTFGGVVQPVWYPDWLAMPIRLHKRAENLYLNIAGGHLPDRPITVGIWNSNEELTTEGFTLNGGDVPIRKNLSTSWRKLHEYGQVHGIHFVVLDRLEELERFDAILLVDRPQESPALTRLMALDIPKYLFTIETEMVNPGNWETAFHERCERIFTWHDGLVDHRRYLKIQSAVDPETPYDFEGLKTAFHQRKLCTLIAGAKLVQHPNELYSERIRAIQWFTVHAPGDFEFYGIGWNPDMFPAYRGAVRDKLATLSRYRFAICYENARNYPGYITETIMDCFLAGVVPVYLGAPNVAEWIPEDCYIDLNRFSDYEQLHAFLKGMDSAAYGNYLDRIQSFLASERTYPFSIENFITTTTAFLVRDVLQRRGEGPDVTVAIPTYNYGRFLELAVSSALAQDVEKLEVLIFDNASTDNTQEVLAQFKTDPRVRIMRNTRNIGAYFNGRNAIWTPTGRYQTTLCADDFYLPSHLGRMVRLMDAHPEIALSYCPCIWVNDKNEVLQVLNHIGHFPADYVGGRNEVADLLTYDCYITPSAALIRRTALVDFPPSDAKPLKGAADWDLWIRIAEQHPDFAFFKDPRVCYRIHAGQDTSFQVAQGHILTDHVEILWDALERGSLHLFQAKADQVLGLLRSKFNLYPHERCAHLEPHFSALERVIRGGDRDISGARASAVRDVMKIHHPSLLDGFLFEWAGEDSPWVETLLAFLEAFGAEDPAILIVLLKAPWTLETAHREVARLMRQTSRREGASVRIMERPEELLGLSRLCRSLRWVPSQAASLAGWTGDLELRMALALKGNGLGGNGC